MVRALIELGADINKCGYHDRGTPLFHAAENGHEAAVWALIEAGADVNKADSDGAPLAIAVQNGHETIVKILKDQGAA